MQLGKELRERIRDLQDVLAAELDTDGELEVLGELLAAEKQAEEMRKEDKREMRRREHQRNENMKARAIHDRVRGSVWTCMWSDEEDTESTETEG